MGISGVGASSSAMGAVQQNPLEARVAMLESELMGVMEKIVEAIKKGQDTSKLEALRAQIEKELAQAEKEAQEAGVGGAALILPGSTKETSNDDGVNIQISSTTKESMVHTNQDKKEVSDNIGLSNHDNQQEEVYTPINEVF